MAEVDNQLTRRYDLIPNFVETVKGYAKHEREVLTEVTEMRPESVLHRMFKTKWIVIMSLPQL